MPLTTDFPASTTKIQPLSSLPNPISTRPPNPPIPPTNITIQPVTPTTLPAYRRLITTLLPIRYQDKYYAESIANQSSSSLALCALWHDPFAASPANTATTTTIGGEVVAGIQCRLEPLPPSSTTATTPSPTRHPPVTTISPNNNNNNNHPQTLYVSTLCTLSPHRTHGIATALLNHILHTLLTHPDYQSLKITSLYAHVWEANEEAVEWYRRRGFEVGERVEGYYRKLRPSGARVVRRGLGVGERVRAMGGEGGFGSGAGGGGKNGVLGERKGLEFGDGEERNG